MITNKLDIVGILITYAEKIKLLKNKEDIIYTVKELKQELNISRIAKYLIDFDY